MNDTLLPTMMDMAVVLRIAELRDRGGPSNSDFVRAQETGQLLAEKGDVLQFGSKKKGEAARIFNEVAHGIAVLAYCPGGVTVFGTHYEARTKKIPPSHGAQIKKAPPPLPMRLRK